MSNSCIYPLILCGGSGTRLWPLSRESYPKQFLSIKKEDNLSLLQKTILRIRPLKNLQKPILVCNEQHRFIVAEQMREININDFIILLEPFGRNTAPAITLAALKSLELEEDPTLLVLSSDHEIENAEKFLTILEKGLEYSEKNKLVTFGVVPTSPEVGYGYIKSSKPLINKLEGIDIECFLEKPNLETAKELIKDKRFTWNSGMFMFKAQEIINEINKFAPHILKICKESISKSIIDLDFQRLDKLSFAKCEETSIDVAVMEKTSKGIVIPLDVGWSDVGSWEVIWQTSRKDINGNFTEGKVILEDTKNSYMRSENRLIVGIDLNDLIVVETRDAILISKKKSSQKVKNVVSFLKKSKIPEGKSHTKVYRPWGHYLSVVEDNRWQVKLIQVKPGEKLSLQMHHHRSEHWVVVSGTAKVEVNDKVEILSENQSVYIPLGSKHRLSNPGKIFLSLIEVQSGSYVGEDDIVRFEDIYGRSK
ncbi:mannose-1-phosphate guanylyltransferase/mannose-6-phosphate isomerase [uncultured Prochlorococcus sp.]|uniref:mannose-1-phosphate guanylyltransferase/mannose-6-phosphate isomerase n=1 Tax=uncultured Prochlorococcus sp. TaxID=159733 RepID=UPI0025882F72|nr:mannose-1-phosphate guanylyltransferase/mannose-6-phosphate isomerase [uncultured Prochlorococcus sp.]